MQPLDVPNMLSTAQISREDSQREIDAQESALQQQILNLRTQRNTFAYIAMLPEDLLVEIFLLVRDSFNPAELNSIQYWHHITHVCRHWRHTAISTPILWTTPPVHLHNYTTLMLERSKDANLHIYFQAPTGTATMQYLSSHVRRVSTLRLHLQRRHLNTSASRKFYDHLLGWNLLFSRLQSVEIECRGGARGYTWPAKGLLLALVPKSASMRSIRLEAVSFGWSLLAPFNLLSLDLCNSNLNNSISCDTLLNTLRQMTRLQRLRLDCRQLLAPHDMHSCQDIIVSLPHLRCFDGVDRDLAYMPHLLARLELPSLNNLEVPAASDFEGYCASSAVSALATTITDGNFKVGNADLRVNDLGIVIGCLPMGHEFVCIGLAPGPNEALAIQLTHQLLKHVIPNFPGLGRVAVEIPLSADELIQYFGNMAQLRMITIAAYVNLIPALTSALAHRCGCHSPHGLHTFPSLDMTGCWDFDWDDVDSSLLANFCEALVQRSGHVTTIKANSQPPEWVTQLLEEAGFHFILHGQKDYDYGF